MKPRYTPLSWRAAMDRVDQELAALADDDSRLLEAARRYIALQDARPSAAGPRRVLEVTLPGPGRVEVQTDEAALKRLDRRQAAQLGAALDQVRRLMGFMG